VETDVRTDGRTDTTDRFTLLDRKAGVWLALVRPTSELAIDTMQASQRRCSGIARQVPSIVE